MESRKYPPPDEDLHILNIEQTIDLLLENPKSFCRYGDGELMYLNGRAQHFQPYDENLARRLREILESSSEKCHIGIDYRYFVPTHNFPTDQREYIREVGNWIRPLLLKYCNRKRLYISSLFTCAHATLDISSNEYAQYLKQIRELFKGRNLVIFSGRTVFDQIKYNVFELAESRQHVFCNSIDAWSQYNEIMEYARRLPKDNSTLCFILGPAATVIAYDLAQEGYMAWDIGHIAKEYDAYGKFIEGNRKVFHTPIFFAPD